MLRIMKRLPQRIEELLLKRIMEGLPQSVRDLLSSRIMEGLPLERGPATTGKERGDHSAIRRV